MSLRAVKSEEKTLQVICPEHGAFMTHPDDWLASCPKCRAEQEAAERQAQLAQAMENACIPARFASKGFGEYQAATQGQRAALKAAHEYCREFQRHRQAGSCLIFSGNPGTGKTHLAISCIRHLVGAGYTGRYTRAFELIEGIRSTWRRDSRKTEKQILQEFTEVDLLVLDEVGVQYGSESETVELFKVLDTRYLDVKPSIIVTNAGIDDLQNYLGVRALDRLREGGGGLVPFMWESYRPKH